MSFLPSRLATRGPWLAGLVSGNRAVVTGQELPLFPIVESGPLSELGCPRLDCPVHGLVEQWIVVATLRAPPLVAPRSKTLAISMVSSL